MACVLGSASRKMFETYSGSGCAYPFHMIIVAIQKIREIATLFQRPVNTSGPGLKAFEAKKRRRGAGRLLPALVGSPGRYWPTHSR